MLRALFIGRFQPFHQGHLDAIKQISEPEIIIGIGSSQYSGTDDNPYSFEEREKMINSVLSKTDLNYKIIAIPDIHDEKNWVEHVKNIVGDFDIVYTGNDWVKKLFEDKEYKVKTIKHNIDISGTKVREMIKNNDDTWKKFV